MCVAGRVIKPVFFHPRGRRCRPRGAGDQAVGFVAKAFKRAVEAFVPGNVPFPGPLTPARARANAIVRAVYGFSAQQQAVVWRRAKNLQVYMA